MSLANRRSWAGVRVNDGSPWWSEGYRTGGSSSCSQSISTRGSSLSTSSTRSSLSGVTTATRSRSPTRSASQPPARSPAQQGPDHIDDVRGRLLGHEVAGPRGDVLEVGGPRPPDRGPVEAHLRPPVLLDDRHRHREAVARGAVGRVVLEVDGRGGAVVGDDRRHGRAGGAEVLG